MQNIKNVVEAIGADIGNINRNYQSLTARLQELESRQATPPEAVGDDGKAAAPSGLVELKYSYAKPDYLRGEHINKQLRLPIPEAYRGKFAIFESNIIKLETDDEGYYQHWDNFDLADEGSVSIWVIHGAPVVQNALQVDFSVETAKKMNAYKLDNYLTDEDKALFPFNAAQFVNKEYGGSWYAMFEQLPRGEGLPEYGESDSESLQYFIGRYYSEFNQELDNLASRIDEMKSYFDEGWYGNDAVRWVNEFVSSNTSEAEWSGVNTVEGVVAVIDKYKNSEPLWREFLPKYTDIRNRLMQELKDRREAQHGEEIRKLVAAGAVLVD